MGSILVLKTPTSGRQSMQETRASYGDGNMGIEGCGRAVGNFWMGAMRAWVDPVGGYAQMGRAIAASTAEAMDIVAPDLVDAFSTNNARPQSLHGTQGPSAQGGSRGSPSLIKAGDQLLQAIYRRHARGNSLFSNARDGSFEDVSISSGAWFGRWAWGCDFLDFNNISLVF